MCTMETSLGTKVGRSTDGEVALREFIKALLCMEEQKQISVTKLTLFYVHVLNMII